MYNETNNVEDITENPSNIFEFDNHLDKTISARRVQNETVAVNENFAIYHGKKFAPMKNSNGTWCYFIATKEVYYEHINRTLTCDSYVEFDTYEEALEFINGFTAFLQWLGEAIAAPQKAEENKTMVGYDKEATREKLMKMYDKKISKVLSTSKQYGIYIKLYAELSIHGVDEALRLAEREIARDGIKISERKCYTWFCINFQRIA